MRNFTIVITIVVWCLVGMAPPTAAKTAYNPERCTCLSISFDKSGSFEQAHTPLDSAWFDRVIDAALCRSLHVAFQLIVDDANRRFCRVTFSVELWPLEGLHLTERLMAKAHNDSVLAEYGREKAAFIAECMSWYRSITPSKTTNLSAAIERSAVLHDEPAYAGWYHLAIFVTDGVSTSKTSPSTQPTAVVLVAGADRRAAKSLFADPLCLESTVGVTEFLSRITDSTSLSIPVSPIHESR